MSNDNGPLSAICYDADGDLMEWVLVGVTARQAVLVRAFLRAQYGRRSTTVSFVGGQTFDQFVDEWGDEWEDFLADGWRRPREEE